MHDKSFADLFFAPVEVTGSTGVLEYKLFPKAVSASAQMFSSFMQMIIAVGVFLRHVPKARFFFHSWRANVLSDWDLTNYLSPLGDISDVIKTRLVWGTSSIAELSLKHTCQISTSYTCSQMFQQPEESPQGFCRSSTGCKSKSLNQNVPVSTGASTAKKERIN